MNKGQKPAKKHFYIYGKNPIEEVLKDFPRYVVRVYAKDTTKEPELASLREHLKKNAIGFVKVPEKKMKQLVGDVKTQGIIAEIREFPMKDIDTVIGGLDMEKNPSVLVLEEIQDPHNFGAIIRSAAAAGVSAVVVSKLNQAPVNATVFKTSAGTVTKIPIVQISNIGVALEKLKKAGFWIAGLAMEGSKKYWDDAYDAPTAFVVGNEGKGLREKTLEKCDFIISVPMVNGVESLNASVSSALVVYEWKRKNQ